MGQLLWGKVYYQDSFAGILREEPGDRVSFTYDESYLAAKNPAIAHTLPLQSDPQVNQNGLHPFFDNLVAEGWLEAAQSKILGKRNASRFELLLGFGRDCAGAVSVIDPNPMPFTDSMLNHTDPKEVALLTSHASLSGIQPKLTLIKNQGKCLPTKSNELSTHFAKFPSQNHSDLIINEYLATQAFKALLPHDDIVEMSLGEIDGFTHPALIIKRFDRDQQQRIHFEEFNQLLNKKSIEKHDGSYKNMANFINTTKNCLPTEIYRLFTRVLAGILLGNTDMHFKNFSMIHTPSGLRLAPSYDQVAAAMYNYTTLALSISESANLPIHKLTPAHIINLGKEFLLPLSAVDMAAKLLAKNIDAAKQTILESELASKTFKNSLVKNIGKQWNLTFASIGQALSKRR